MRACVRVCDTHVCACLVCARQRLDCRHFDDDAGTRCVVTHTVDNNGVPSLRWCTYSARVRCLTLRCAGPARLRDACAADEILATDAATPSFSVLQVHRAMPQCGWGPDAARAGAAQWSTFAPGDTVSRWMGSVAIDQVAAARARALA